MTSSLSSNRERTSIEALDALLSESEDSARLRSRTAFDAASAPFSDRLVLFGAGRLGQRTSRGLQQVGLQPLAFVDNNLALQGKSIDGILIMEPASAAEAFANNAAFVITVWGSAAKDRMQDRVQQLKQLGCQRVVPVGQLFWKFPDVFLPFFPLDLPHKVLPHGAAIQRAFALFYDDESRLEFLAQLRFRLFMEFEGMAHSKGPDLYLHSGIFEVGSSEVLIDCGAFDGDSIEDFIRFRGDQFDRIVAFEPDASNLEKLGNRVRGFPVTIQEKITSFPFALGSAPGTLYFARSGSDQSRAGAGDHPVQRVTLDDTLSGIKPTLIKFDIEGAELDALIGATQLIARDRPVLAVSSYHEQSHLWEVPLRLAELCPDYKFFLRPHGAEGWDLMCYAVPRERCTLG